MARERMTIGNRKGIRLSLWLCFPSVCLWCKQQAKSELKNLKCWFKSYFLLFSVPIKKRNAREHFFQGDWKCFKVGSSYEEQNHGWKRENFPTRGKNSESGRINTNIEVRKRLFSLGIIIIVVSSSSYNVMLSVYIHIILCTCFTLHTIFSLYCYYLSTSKWEKVETSQFFSFSLYTVFASTRSKI